LELKDKIRLDQLRQINDQLSASILSSAILGIILGFLIFSSGQHGVFAIWLITLVATVFLRLLMISLLRAKPIREGSSKFWNQLTIGNVLLSSVNYSIAALAMLFIEDAQSRAICIIIFAGVIAGAVALYGMYQKLLVLFSAPIIISLVLVHLIDFSTNNAVLAFMFMLFTYIVYKSSKQLYTHYVNTHIQNETIRNLTAEQILLEEKHKIRNDFFASMSHEIRTPLNGIIGLVDMLKKTRLSEEQRDYVLTMKKSSNVLLNTVNDVLDLSKLEAGKFELRSSEFNIRDVVSASMDLYQPLLSEKNLKSEIDYQNIVEDTGVIGDETRILQIINNFLSNAVKFTEKGEVKILVKKETDADLQDWLFVKISDSGIGIPEVDLERIFNRYDQVMNHSKASFKDSTGLGLNICKELVELMKGEIGAYNNENGASFWFRVPIFFKDVQSARKEVNERKGKVGRGLKVLVVDDRPVNLKVQSLMLSKLGFEVVAFDKAKSALEELLENPLLYQGLFTDIQMPDMDGIELTEKVRAFNKEIIIIGVSAQVNSEFIETPQSFGLNNYMIKPVTLDKIEEVASKYFVSESV
jgi:signal transduction histidine kinase/CheY-like chemotaxis protein